MSCHISPPEGAGTAAAGEEEGDIPSTERPARGINSHMETGREYTIRSSRSAVNRNPVKRTKCVRSLVLGRADRCAPG